MISCQISVRGNTDRNASIIPHKCLTTWTNFAHTPDPIENEVGVQLGIVVESPLITATWAYVVERKMPGRGNRERERETERGTYT